MKPPNDYPGARPRPELSLLASIIVFVTILFTVIVSGCTLNYKMDGTVFENKEAHAYVDQVVPIITTHWQDKDLTERAHPGLRKVLTGDKLPKMFQMFARKLGPLKKYKGATQVSIKTTVDGEGQHTLVDYLVDVDFEKGPAQIKMTVVDENKKLSILNFYVNSEAFLSEARPSWQTVPAGSIAH